MPHRDPAKERYWRRVLRQWRRSGLTARDFCIEQSVSEPNFYAWRREIERRDRQRRVTVATTTVIPPVERVSPAFVKLSIDNNGTNAPPIDVVLSERRFLRVRAGFDAELLRQLLRLLEEPGC